MDPPKASWTSAIRCTVPGKRLVGIPRFWLAPAFWSENSAAGRRRFLPARAAHRWIRGLNRAFRQPKSTRTVERPKTPSLSASPPVEYHAPAGEHRSVQKETRALPGRVPRNSSTEETSTGTGKRRYQKECLDSASRQRTVRQKNQSRGRHLGSGAALGPSPRNGDTPLYALCLSCNETWQEKARVGI